MFWLKHSNETNMKESYAYRAGFCELNSMSDEKSLLVYHGSCFYNTFRQNDELHNQ